MFTLWGCSIFFVHLLCRVHSTESYSKELDQEAVAFMLAMLAAIYHSPKQRGELGAVIEDFDFALLGCKGGLKTNTINMLEGEMVTRPSALDLLSTICHLCFDLLSNEKYARKKNNIVKQQYNPIPHGIAFKAVNSNVNKALKSCSLNNWKSKTVLWLNWIWKIRGSTHLVILLDLKY